MLIMHFDLIRIQREYCWLQGIGAVRSINVDDLGSKASMRLEHAMSFEVVPSGDEPEPSTLAPKKSQKRQSGTVGRCAE